MQAQCKVQVAHKSADRWEAPLKSRLPPSPGIPQRYTAVLVLRHASFWHAVCYSCSIKQIGYTGIGRLCTLQCSLSGETEERLGRATLLPMFRRATDQSQDVKYAVCGYLRQLHDLFCSLIISSRHGLHTASSTALVHQLCGPLDHARMPRVEPAHMVLHW